MKTLLPPNKPKEKTLSEKEEFFEKCFLSLLSGAMSEFEVRTELNVLEIPADDNEERDRVEELVDRAFRMAQEATVRYMEHKQFTAAC